MNHRIHCWACSWVLAVAGAACNPKTAAEATWDGAAKDEASASRESERRGKPGGTIEAAVLSDLDRPVSELLGIDCEHQKKAYECDECRHEVGFVKVPASLLEGGLVSTVKVESQRVTTSIVLTGEVRFDERRVALVSTRVEGIVKKVLAVLGDRVKKGQPLLEIESVMVGEGQAADREAQGMLVLARRNFERISELRKENISSEKEFLQAKQELETAEIRAQWARAKLYRWGARGNKAGEIVLCAPRDGTVLAMRAVAGGIAKADEPLVTVGDNTAVWVWADLGERDIAWVKKSLARQTLAAVISVKAYPGEEFPGTVELISPAMDEFSRTVKVRVQVKNDGGRLLAGMFAKVKLFLPGTDETLVVPRAAVLEDEGRSFVFVHHHGEFYVRRPVVRGRAWAGWVEIEKGLEPSQIVVAEGAFLLKSDVLRKKMGAGCAD